MFSRWSKILSDIFEVEEDRETLYVSCPFHNDKRPSMLVSPRIDYWICYSNPNDDECGSGRIRQLVAKYYDVSILEAEKMAPPLAITEKTNLLPDYDEDFNMKNKKNRKNNNKLLLGEELPEVILEDFNPKLLPRFILDRGFDKNTLKEWGCGLDEKSKGLTIPVKDEQGRIVGTITRRPEGYNPKYMYNEHMPRSKMIFGLEKVLALKEEVPFVAITEGSLDTIWLWKFGYHSVAILGSHVSAQQKILLTKLPTREIALCFDNDKSGEQVKNQVRETLGNLFFMSKIIVPEGYKDIQEVREEKLIHEVIDNRARILF